MQLVSVEHSLCMVKVFMNASLGCICFARGLIHQDSTTFQNRRVDDLSLLTVQSASLSYQDFLSFNGQLSTRPDSQEFKILVRGRHKRADSLLNLLVCEFSIFFTLC